MIKEREKESFIIAMENVMMVNGRMAISTDLAYITIKMEIDMKDNQSKENVKGQGFIFSQFKNFFSFFFLSRIV